MSVPEWQVVSRQLAGRSVGETPAAWIAHELALVEAAEQLKAWADFQAIAALRRMREAVGAQCEVLYDQSHFLTITPPSAATMEREADMATVDEVVLATGLPAHTVRARLEVACAPVLRCGPGLSMLAAGRTSIDRLTRIIDATTTLDDVEVAVICRRVLAELPPEPGSDGEPYDPDDPTGSAPPRPRSHAWFTRQLRRQVALHQIDPARTHSFSLAQRTVYGQLCDDGTGSLTVTGDGPRITAALDRIDRIARHLRGTGDARTLSQLRSDATLDLLLTGWTTDPARVMGQPSSAGSADSGDEVSWPTGTLVGAPPPARVTIVVNLTTLLGVDDDVAEIPGHGYLPAAMARQAALAAGSAWRRLVVDPVSGHALDLSTHHYRPTAAMTAFVAALDGSCRAPGCTVRATACDLDHTLEWPAGATTIANLAAVHRRHHNHKTRRTWTCHPAAPANPADPADPARSVGTCDPLSPVYSARPVPWGDPDDAPDTAGASERLEGLLTWTTLAGRHYTTAPHDYLDADQHQANDDDHALAERQAVLRPPPF